MRILLAAVFLCTGCHHNPNAPKPVAGQPSCNIHAHQAGNTCECDIGYSGDGISCDADHPTCDANASWDGSQCNCDPGFHGDGTTCTMDTK